LEQALQDKTKALDALQAELDSSLLQATELGRQAAQREEAVRGECEAVRGECESLRAQLVVAHAKEMEERAAREQAQLLQAGDASEDAVNELTALLEEQKILAAQAEENRATLSHELNACCAKLAEAQDALNAAQAAAAGDRDALQGPLC
jgi:chromosome segregation ATPase